MGLFFFILCADSSFAGVQLVPFEGSAPTDTSIVQVAGQNVPAWQTKGNNRFLTFKPRNGAANLTGDSLYLAVTYLDQGYGRLTVTYLGLSGEEVKPDKFTSVVFMDTGKLVTAYARWSGIKPTGSVQIKIKREKGQDHSLAISSVRLEESPIPDAHFQYVLSEPWKRPYKGTTVPPADNTTLKGKVMVGYQGWFRTPNDPCDRGWGHWGDISNGHFSTDMWPEVSQYPPEALEKAAEVKTLSGKTGYLFSSAWPETAQVHFRWMKENNIDGAFVQRFGGDNWVINKYPQWVLGAVREAANREGRIWAIEYDLSGVPDALALDHVQKDWAWLVDEFGLLKDPNYARVNGKPVVFLWGMGVGGRHITPETTLKLVDFFKNDPKYGGNYFIGGGPGRWRTLAPEWLSVFKKFDGLLGWMSTTYAEDLAQCKTWGVDYYGHVWPGFSWANLKHLPSASTAQLSPRDGGKLYNERIDKAIKAGVDRLFVGMFDEYNESTAIIPMSDDPPPTPERLGTELKFYANPKEQENANVTELKPQIAYRFNSTTPAKGLPETGVLMRWSGNLIPPSDGIYTLEIQGVLGDSATLWLNDKRVLEIKKMNGLTPAKTSFQFEKGKSLFYRLDYQRNTTASGEFQLLWTGPGTDWQPIPASCLKDIWGRFITNEGQPSDLYLKLTGQARDWLNVLTNTPVAGKNRRSEQPILN